MYKTTEVYEVGMRNSIAVKIAAIEKMVDSQNAKNTIIVVHMFGESHIVLKDITAHYGLPKNILCYQVRNIKNFDKLKKHGRLVTIPSKHLFMYNTENGMWDNRWPDYERSHIKNNDRSEANLVRGMLKGVLELPIDIHKTYIREAEKAYQPEYAKYYFRTPIPSNGFKAGEAYFDIMFKLSQTQRTNEKCIVKCIVR